MFLTISVIADFLRPILPIIKRLKFNDLSALDRAEPRLILLSEYDGLEQAIAKATEEERLEREPLPKPLSELLAHGIAACQEKRYPKAIKYLEDYCQDCHERDSKDYIQAQMWLIRAYQMGGQLQRAIALCQLLTTHVHPQVQTWAKRCLKCVQPWLCQLPRRLDEMARAVQAWSVQYIEATESGENLLLLGVQCHAE